MSEKYLFLYTVYKSISYLIYYARSDTNCLFIYINDQITTLKYDKISFILSFWFTFDTFVIFIHSYTCSNKMVTNQRIIAMYF